MLLSKPHFAVTARRLASHAPENITSQNPGEVVGHPVFIRRLTSPHDNAMIMTVMRNERRKALLNERVAGRNTTVNVFLFVALSNWPSTVQPWLTHVLLHTSCGFY